MLTLALTVYSGGTTDKRVQLDCGSGDTGGGGSNRLTAAAYFDRLASPETLLVASPAGHGLDTHGTWEALLAGCIPIVPRSSLDGMFEEEEESVLPVWLIDSWEEVTQSSVHAKIQEVWTKLNKGRDEGGYDWDKIYATGWVREIQAVADQAAGVHAATS